MSTKSAYRPTDRVNPYGLMLGLRQFIGKPGVTRCELDVGPKFHSPAKSVHGGLLFTVMDNCMGAALVSTLALEEGEACATIEMKINFLKPVFEGRLMSATRVLQKGKRIAVLESQLSLGKTVVAIATATYAIFKRQPVTIDAGGGKAVAKKRAKAPTKAAAKSPARKAVKRKASGAAARPASRRAGKVAK